MPATWTITRKRRGTMKTRTILALTLVLSFVLGGVVLAATYHYQKPMCRPGSVPSDACIDTGDAYYECGQIRDENGDLLVLDWAKRVGPTERTWVLMDQGDLVQRIEITAIDPKRTEFSWEALEDDNPVGAVIIKSEGKGKEPGGTVEKVGGYSIYTYNPRVMEDSGLRSYNIGNRYYQIDHITFCWNEVDENGDDECYQEETAWADGLPYIDASQWAMYVTYDPEGMTVEIYAGKTMLAGTATFSAPVDGEVTITINLDNGFVFYYDPADTEFDENLKVQDYAFPPEGNPPIGHFDWKASIEPGSTTAEITVPVNNYYGVHLDVAYPLDECPEE
jgi:hypothetical protein